MRTVLLVPTAPGVGLTSTCLGLVRAIDRRGIRVGYLKPFAQHHADGGQDRSTDLVRAMSPLQPPDPIPVARLEHQLGVGGLDVVLEEVVSLYQPVEVAADVVVVEGLNPGPELLYSSRLNQAVAGALDADVLLVGAWRSGEPAGPVEVELDHLAETLAIAATPYRLGEVQRVVGCVVNRVPPDPDATLAERLRQVLDGHQLRLVAMSPDRPALRWPRVVDLVGALGARVLRPGDQTRRIEEATVFAQAVPGGLGALTAGKLVIVPGDRYDAVMAVCLAALNGTPLAALLLTAGIEPDPRVWELTKAASDTGLPILLVGDLTYDAVVKVRGLDPELPADDHQRVEAVTTIGADGFDEAWLEGLPTSPLIRRLSPAAFRYRLVEEAHKADACIVLPEGTEPRTVHAAVLCAERGIARSVLLGVPDEVDAVRRTLGLRLPEGVEVLDPRRLARGFVDELVEVRRHKGMTHDMAREQLGSAVTVGTMMLRAGQVEGLVSGALHTTADTVRPALQILGTGKGAKLVSSVFFMCLPADVVVYGDCAINPQPNAEELADIALQSAASARAFGIDPRVAMISFSTGSSGSGVDVDKVVRATELVRATAPDLAVDGPLQYDAAAIASVGLSKRPGSPVAGRANVYIFPDLDTGNTTYKAVQRSADVLSIGPVLQGLSKPVNDLSRGATVEDIVYTLAITAIQARLQPGVQFSRKS